MKINLQPDGDQPIYQQIVNSIVNDIESDVLGAGYRLPTVRDLSDKLGVSRGTVKHAYDRLENMGLIEMTQGRGTFVREREKHSAASVKEYALNAMDSLLDELQAAGFTMRDIHIFFELKMREREEKNAAVRIGAVDCSPEALTVITRQLSELPGVEIHPFLLSEVLSHPQILGPDIDLVVTTDTHFHQLENKLLNGKKLMRIVLSAASVTVRELAGLHGDTPAGIVCASKRFASVIQNGCREHSALSRDPDIFLFGSNQGMVEFVENKKVLVIPSYYHKFCSSGELEILAAFTAGGGKLIPYNYSIDKGSLLYVTEEVERLRSSAWF